MNRLLLILFGVLLDGCVIVPYTPDAQTAHETRPIPEQHTVMLSGGPRRFLDEVGEAIATEAPRVTVMPALEFRDAVFPDGNWTLSNLFADASRERVNATGLDFLVVLGQMHYEEDDSDNKMIFLYGFYGYLDVDTHAVLNALLVDLAAIRPVDMMRVESDAAIRGVGAFYGLFLTPRTQHGVKQALAQELARALKTAKPDGAIHIAVLAAESADGLEDPLQLDTQVVAHDP